MYRNSFSRYAREGLAAYSYPWRTQGASFVGVRMYCIRALRKSL